MIRAIDPPAKTPIAKITYYTTRIDVFVLVANCLVIAVTDYYIIILFCDIVIEYIVYL